MFLTFCHQIDIVAIPAANKAIIVWRIILPVPGSKYAKETFAWKIEKYSTNIENLIINLISVTHTQIYIIVYFKK